MTRSRDTASIIPTVDAKGDLLAGTANNEIDNLSVGSNGTYLKANSSSATGLEWGTGVESIVDAKGDLLVGTADNTVDNLPAGTNGQLLTANSATATGLEWTTQITPGLVPIIPTSVTTVSGSASINATTGLVTFTGVGTLNIDGAFTSTYNHYKILFTSSGASVNTQVGMQLRDSGVSYATANQRSHAFYYSASGGGTNAGGSESGANLTVCWIQGTAGSLNAFTCDLYNPFNATQTTYNSTFTSYVSGHAGGGVPTTTQYTGISIINAGTFSGTLKIYGYN
jgi:hypothetical protein